MTDYEVRRDGEKRETIFADDADMPILASVYVSLLISLFDISLFHL